MPYDDRQIEELLRVVAETRDQELDCDGCLDHVAEFLEGQVAGRSPCEAMRAVEQHLAVCGECRDEYEALRAALKQTGDNAP